MIEQQAAQCRTATCICQYSSGLSLPIPSCSCSASLHRVRMSSGPYKADATYQGSQFHHEGCHCPNAGELEHLLDAQLWSDAHQLLCLRLAPQLFLASYSQDGFAPTEQQQQMESKLQGFLSQMSTHHQQLAPPASMLTQPEADWYIGGLTEGAGVYSIYYSLRVRFDFCDEWKVALHPCQPATCCV